MNDTQYGKHVREREAANRKRERLITGKDNNTHHMNIQRKAARGIAQFADVTRLMPAEKLTFIRKRAVHVAVEAVQRQWILNLPFGGIAKRVK